MFSEIGNQQNIMKIKLIIRNLCIGFISLMATAQYAIAQVSKPNVIIIYADDLGYGDLSCYGATQIQTPNIDKLARGGIRFTNAHSTASTCTPSRYSLLTGEYAFRNKDAHILPGDASMLVPLDRATLGTVFQKAGYKTAVVGKWHIGLGTKKGINWNEEVKPSPNDVGFDYSFIFPATADRVPTIYLKNHHVIALEPTDSIAVSYNRKTGNEATGRDHPELLKMKASHRHDGTIVNGIGRIGWMSGGRLARWTDEELAGDFLAEAKRFITQNRDKPFFLYYPVNEIHVPRMPATRFKGKSKLGYRGDVTLEMDYVVGEILKTLNYLDLIKNTLVIFSSDNGPVLDDGYVDYAVQKANGHKPAGYFRGGKYSMFEGGTRIPFIVSWPGSIEPGVSDALISQVDLLSSFAKMARVKLESRDGRDSQNLLDVLIGKSGAGRKSYIEQNNGAVLAYIEDGWKYIEPGNGPALFVDVNIESGLSKQPQLYNLNIDPGESKNLASQYPEKVKEMAEVLKKLRLESGILPDNKSGMQKFQ